MPTDEVEDDPQDDINPRRKYKSKFPDFDLHHLTPTSRIPSSEKIDTNEDEFNLFPYKGRPHSDYHHIFWNLKIDQLWRMRRRIFTTIFESRDEYVIPWWFKFCSLDIGTDKKKAVFEKEKKNRLEKSIYLSNLQENWVGAFGGPDLVTAEDFLRLMMLFMVFGTKLLDKDTIFNNGNLVHFFEATRCTPSRAWAYEQCFGKCGTDSSMRKKIVSIVDRFDYYSRVIL